MNVRKRCRPSPRPPARPVRLSGVKGVSLVEVLVVLVVVAIFFGVVASPADRAWRKLTLRAAGREMATLFRQVRTEAIISGRYTGVVFDRANGYTYGIYSDGNGNGIRTVDIRKGIDVLLRGPRRVGGGFAGVSVRILPIPGIPKIPPDRGPLEELDDPVKFGPTDIVSFSPDGTSTSGTLYLSVGRDRMAAVRLLGTTARPRQWELDPRWITWSVL